MILGDIYVLYRRNVSSVITLYRLVVEAKSAVEASQLLVDWLHCHIPNKQSVQWRARRNPENSAMNPWIASGPRKTEFREGQ